MDKSYPTSAQQHTLDTTVQTESNNSKRKSEDNMIYTSPSTHGSGFILPIAPEPQRQDKET